MENEKNRKLSKAEQERLDCANEVTEKLKAEGYTCTNLTIGILKANIMACILGIPFVLAIGISYFLYQNKNIVKFIPNLKGGIIIAVLMVILIVVHELLHGLFWGIFSKNHMRDIAFGFIMEYLTPYCTCKAPLKKYQYIIGSIAPGLFLGIIPGIISIFIGSATLFWLSVIMIISAGGDFTIILKLLMDKGTKDTIYLDHPTQVGLLVFKK